MIYICLAFKRPMRLRQWIFGLFLVALIFAQQSCFDEEFTMSGDAVASFSLDTLQFDTVFTETGSVTRSFRVFNENDLGIKLSRITLEGTSSQFRINVDGVPGPEVRDIEILAGDSIWVFVEVTVDPDQDISVSPFVIEDNVVFEVNGNTQKVLLQAWGQNANYVPSRDFGNSVAILSCDLGQIEWDDPKPYVIYGTILIDSCTLIWPEGTRVYVHGGFADNDLGVYNDGLIFTLPQGRIVTRGTVENPVLVQDDRIEEEFSSVWNGIRLGPGSGPHFFKNTTIANAVTGLVVDSAARVNLENVVIHGSAGSGLFARLAQVEAVNSLFYDNGGAGVALTYGGNYTFDFCTIASYGNDSEGLVMNNFFCSDPLCSTGARVTDMNALLRNVIVAGSARDEVSLTNAAPDEPQIDFDVRLENCIVTVDDLLDEERWPNFFPEICSDCVEYEFGDTLFVDREMSDYHLDTMSIAEKLAKPLPGIVSDLDGLARDPFSPDIGCYEFQD